MQYMHSALWQRYWTRHALNGVCCLRTGLEKSEKLLWLKFLEAKPVPEILEKMSSRECSQGKGNGESRIRGR